MMFNFAKFLEINSRTARQIAIDSIASKKEIQFIECMYKIKKASRDGDFCVCLNFDLYEDVKKRLIGLGYKIDNVGRYEHYRICWMGD